MRRSRWNARRVICAIGAAFLAVVAASRCAIAQAPADSDSARTPAAQATAGDHATHAAAAAPSHEGEELRAVVARLERIASWVTAWYRRTPPAERVTWGGMFACAGLLGFVVLERMARLNRRKILPTAFTARFLDRLHDGKLDCGQALDHCELNPSPAARVALAAVRRWGRPATDLERAVALAHRVETDRLRRNVGSLRRIAALAPLLGVLGTLFALGRALEGGPVAVARGSGASVASVPAPVLGDAWGPALAATLTPLSTGIVIATLALVAFDALTIRIEKLAGGLDRLGAETIDAVALAAPISIPTMTLAASEPRAHHQRPGTGRAGAAYGARSPHQSYFRADEGTGMISHGAEHGDGQ